MTAKVPQVVWRAVGQRITGKRPSTIRAVVTAAFAGALAATLTYRALRG